MSDSHSHSRPARIRRILEDRLPEEVLLPITWRRSLATVFLTVLFFVAINLLIKWYLIAYPINRGYWVTHEKWEMLDSLSEPAEWLILGDSSAIQGVVPSVIEEQLGGQAINLATTAGIALLDDVWMLEEHIERYGPPKNVLVVHTVDVWDRDIAYQGSILIAKIPRPWGFWRASAVDPGLDSDLWIDIFLARYLPLYGETGSLLTVLGRAIVTPERLFENPYRMEPDGYIPVNQTSSGSTVTETEETINKFEQNGFYISPINQTALDRMVALADEHDFELYLANGPLYEGLAQASAIQEFFADLNQTLEESAGRSNNAHYLTLLAGMPLEQMQNIDHVNHAAAEVYSQMLASEINRIQAGAGTINPP